jgi:predicted TIM-barrel fold metal-dependent hydrolase
MDSGDRLHDLFHDAASIDYPILDCDAHVNEPPDTWTARVPARLRERAPKVLHRDDGDYWSFDDGASIRPVGLTATAGRSFLDFSPVGGSYATMRPGSFDTKARLADMDVDGIWLQVLYPSVTLFGAKVYGSDRDLQRACVRAYNDWLAEFCEGSDGRLIGQAILPTTGVDDCVEELHRAVELGHRGVVISAFPNGTLEPLPEDEPFWQLAQESRTPVAVHIGSFLPTTGTAAGAKPPVMNVKQFMGAAGATKSGAQTLPVVCQLLFSGVFERFTEIDLLLVESNIGWIPTLLEQTDDMFYRYRFFTHGDEMAVTPSRIFHRNFWASFMIDTVGMDLRHRLNIDHLMWSSDYPHTGCDWPNSRITIERNFRGVPKDQVKKMLHDNCKRLYRLDDVPDRIPHL